MAQTKRKRQTKHRGNAAGVVESRGRTGRKPTAAEKSGKPGDAARAKQQLLDKRDRPPTWRGAFVRSMIAAILFLLAVIVLFNKSNQAIALFPIVLLLYTPLSYYSDQWIYNRRQRRKAGRGGNGKAASR
jgi:hypothetical protein